MGDGGKVDNPWLGLSRDAHAKHDRLRLDPGSAEAGAKYAAEAITSLNAARGYAYLLDQYSGFSNNGVLQSALNLQDRFAKQGGRVGGIIDDYIALLNAMGDTFVAAGKTYRMTDDQSKSDFDAIKTQANIDVHFDGIPLDGATQLSTWSDQSSPTPSDANGMGDMAKVAKEKSGRYTDSIGSEDPSHHDGKWFFDVGQGINPTPIADRSALWKWIAQVISSSFETLTGCVKRLESDGHWTGQGVEAAIAASRDFEAQATEFSTDLYAVAENLLYTATWLSQTKAGMPLVWQEDYRGTSTETYIIKTGTAAFTSWYIPGIGNSSTTIPILVDPTDPSSHAPSSSPRNDYRGSGPDNRGGGPHGSVSPTGPGAIGDPGSKKPGGKTDPKGTHPGKDDPKAKDHQDPNGKDGKDSHGKDGKDPNGGKTDPTGKNPNGTGSNPDGTNQNSSNPNSSSTSGQNSGLSGLQSALQSMTSAASQNTDQKKQQDLKDALKDSPLTNLLDDLKQPGGSPGGGGPGGSPAKPLLEAANARLFPRAAVAAEAVESSVSGVARAGVAASGAGMGGMGGGMGGMGHGGGAHGAQGGKEHKRPDFLDSNEYLDEAMGKAPIVAKPVVEG
ncbi:hypothetical protein [Nocardia niigatensis]|uniref:hypothetical protein n=1 Tax=Nocardia niigatensis TaxID=209249 RepID=UPI0002FB34C4|nr:hypothetical protein [Nocardia niigatensis]